MTKIDEAGLEAAAQLVDPSGIFNLTWPECHERAKAIVTAYLSATQEPLPQGHKHPHRRGYSPIPLGVRGGGRRCFPRLRPVGPVCLRGR